jgi:hypothetical protein
LRRRALSTKQLQLSSGLSGIGVKAAGWERSRRELNRRTNRDSIGRYYCNNNLVSGIKRRCRVIDRRLFSESGRQNQPKGV